MTSNELRQSFLDFFREKQHTIVPSSSLLPDAPNLLFTNAGMNQFVPIFLGQRAPDVDKWPGAVAGLPVRAADTQKIIRAGGKHNDLEDVGFDTYHHTFFEMLGNWSFGDYFKKEAIDWAWELLVKRWGFPPERLYATYFEGDKVVPEDTESRELWLQYLPADHIVPGNRKDNFWMMADTGPCGPNSEIHMDLTPAGNGGKLVNVGDPQCIEIWNLVFIQFNALPDGTFASLPARHVDTGMGFERVCSMIQGTNNFKDFTRPISNYETDGFSPILRELEKLSGKKYGSTLPSSGGASVPACAPRRGLTEFKCTFRDLPHWQSPGSVYFVTFRTHEGRALDNAMRDLVLEACCHGHGQKYHLYAVTVMPDHVHLLLWPRPLDSASPEKGFADLGEILHSIKSYTANQIQRRWNWQGAVWQHESFDRIVRDAQEFSEKWDYIANNAVKKQLAKEPAEYRWFWYPTEVPGAEETKKEPALRPAAQAGTLAPPAAGDDQVKIDMAFRVVADHIRCLSFAIADGIQPSNEGRGYVLRRILRRAIRYGRDLGFHEPFFYKLVDLVAESLGGVFPELRRRKADIAANVKAEEESFNRTLDRGIELFENYRALMNDKLVSGEYAYMLVDTYGFPLDLIELMARENGMTVDIVDFNKRMEEQRARARRDHQSKKQVIEVVGDKSSVAATDFVGYETLRSRSIVQAVQRADKPGEFQIVCDQTPFYAEMGGQVGDAGWMNLVSAYYGGGGLGRFDIVDTQKQGSLFAHRARVQSGRDPEKGDEVDLIVDPDRRQNIQRHHTVTHLFHWALHEVVSKDARQRGSLVAPDHLRFDFNHPEKLSEQHIADIEKLVNDRIQEDAHVWAFSMKYADVKGNPKVMQFFGDKYGDEVRVVQIGGHEKGLDGFSMELCGGTHTQTTEQIERFKIMRESAVAAGIRRVEAVCGMFAAKFIDEKILQEFTEADKAKARELERELAKQRQAAMQSQAPAIAEQLLGRARPPGAPLVSEVPGATAEMLRTIVDALKPKLTSAVVVLGGTVEGKVSLICYVTADLVKAGKHAGKIVGALAKICGGGGGGKPDLAQAGGKQPEKLAEALAAAPRIIGS